MTFVTDIYAFISFHSLLIISIHKTTLVLMWHWDKYKPSRPHWSIFLRLCTCVHALMWCRAAGSALHRCSKCSTCEPPFQQNQYNTIQYNTIQYNAMQCNAMQCNAMQCNAMQCNTIQYIGIVHFSELDRSKSNVNVNVNVKVNVNAWMRTRYARMRFRSKRVWDRSERVWTILRKFQYCTRQTFRVQIA